MLIYPLHYFQLYSACNMYVCHTKELYKGTPNSDIRKLCTVHCGRNVKKPSAPTEVEGKGLKVWCDITVQQKTMIFGFLVNMENTIAIYSYSTPLALFPQKWYVAPEFFVLISSHCCTQIWRKRYGGSWSIYFLGKTMLAWCVLHYYA